MLALQKTTTSVHAIPTSSAGFISAASGVPGRIALKMFRRDRLLTVVALILFASAAGMSLLSLFDERLVTGLNPWIKPTKFAVSFALYFLTLGWLLTHLRGHDLAVRTIRWLSAAGILLEMPVLVGQAARGVSSHFNTTSLFDFSLSALMGIGAFTQMGMLAWALVLFGSRSVELPRAYALGIRAGMGLVLLGVVPAIGMLLLGQHNVGVADGGAALPLLNWSTVGGDLRIAHFLGLHALQVLPCAGFLLSRCDKRLGGHATTLLIALAGIYAFGMIFTFAQALVGQPFITLP